MILNVFLNIGQKRPFSKMKDLCLNNRPMTSSTKAILSKTTMAGFVSLFLVKPKMKLQTLTFTQAQYRKGQAVHTHTHTHTQTHTHTDTDTHTYSHSHTKTLSITDTPLHVFHDGV